MGVCLFQIVFLTALMLWPSALPGLLAPACPCGLTGWQGQRRWVSSSLRRPLCLLIPGTSMVRDPVYKQKLKLLIYFGWVSPSETLFWKAPHSRPLCCSCVLLQMARPVSREVSRNHFTCGPWATVSALPFLFSMRLSSYHFLSCFLLYSFYLCLAFHFHLFPLKT